MLPDKLEKLLTASVIISMSLTPLLASLAVYLGDVVERIDASGGLFGEVQVCGIDDPQADALFNVIDADGSGTIDANELRSYLLGGGDDASRANDAFDTLFQSLDLNRDGFICRDELREGYLDLVAAEGIALVGGAEDEGALDAKMERYTKDTYADVNPMMAGLQNMMGGGGAAPAPTAAAATDAAPSVPRRKGDDQPPPVKLADLATQFIAFDRNPERVALGQEKGVRVVYGDGASPVLLKAAGVEQPRAIVVTYANDKRVLEATRRLRDAYPSASIFARGRTALDAESLLQAGATEVVVESVEAAVRFATLLGTPAEAADSLLRAPLTAESLLVATTDVITPDSSGLRQATEAYPTHALTLTLTPTPTLNPTLTLTRPTEACSARLPTRRRPIWPNSSATWPASVVRRSRRYAGCTPALLHSRPTTMARCCSRTCAR